MQDRSFTIVQEGPEDHAGVEALYDAAFGPGRSLRRVFLRVTAKASALQSVCGPSRRDPGEGPRFLVLWRWRLVSGDAASPFV